MGSSAVPLKPTCTPNGNDTSATGAIVHLGVEKNFIPARKAHPAFVDDLAAMITKAMQAAIYRLFDHRVSAREHRGRHGEAEGFYRFEIDHGLVLCRCLYRHLGRLLALQDAINVAGRLPELVDKIGSVGNRATIVDEARLLEGGEWNFLLFAYRCDVR